MSVDVSTMIVIERPIAEVAAFAGDPSNAPAWHRRIDNAEWVTDPPIALGSQIEFRARFLGRRLVYTDEVTELTPGEQVAMRTAKGRYPMATTSTWRPVGDRATHMLLRNHGEPAGLSRLLGPVIARVTHRAMKRDLADLKRLLESRS